MKDSLQPGLTHTLQYKVPDNKTVAHLFPEVPVIASYPPVFATGFMVGLFEWTCIELMTPHLDEGEGSVGIHVDFSHTAATPPGFTITVNATCIKVDGRLAEFEVEGHDGVDSIGKGLHRRAVVRWESFNQRVEQKRSLG